MSLKKMLGKALTLKQKQKIFELEEYYLGRRIIKNSPHLSPDFMIIGAPKSGTTSLFQYLAQHQNIVTPDKKELLFFRNEKGSNIRGYLQHFPKKEDFPNRITFEASPSYIYYHRGLDRIHRLFPKIKVILLLRDPVERAFSQWNFNQKGSPFLKTHPKALDNRSFKDAVEEELASSSLAWPLFQYVYRSQYTRHLKKLYEIFDGRQILVLDAKRLKEKPKETLIKVCHFLEIENQYQDFQKTDKKQAGLLETKDRENGKKLISYNSSPYKKEINPETKAFLQEYFSQFDKEIIELTGRKFSWMNHKEVEKKGSSCK